MTKEVACPTCGKSVPWSRHARWRPFCSERCRLIDLGAWFGESFRLPADDQATLQDRDPCADEGQDRSR